MPSAVCEQAINEALLFGNALLKFISPNDVGITGSHQCGFYLPKLAWCMFTPHAPRKGRLDKHAVTITWQDGRITKSVITWYGKGTRSEYRLTRFGRDFPFLAPENVGDLLVLIAKSRSEFSAFVLDLDEDIEEIEASLGVEPFEQWGIFENGVPKVETEDQCLNREFTRFIQTLDDFPTGKVFSDVTREALRRCIQDFGAFSADDALLKCVGAEYQLFRLAERQICQSEITKLFRNIDDFLQTAARIMNRRKSRAGRSLENHVDYLLKTAAIPHQMRPQIDGKPDIIIPCEQAYYDRNYPVEKLFVVGVKTTCKDRWRQVLNEGKRVRHKYILTIQQGISGNQLTEMDRSGVRLVVPAPLQSAYRAPSSVSLLSIERFMQIVRARLA